MKKYSYNFKISPIKKFLSIVELSSVWIFLTEKCNLSCDYCFFKFRDNKKSIPFKKLKILLDKLPRNKKINVVISGGEPCYEWDTVKRIFKYIKDNFLNYDLMIETNCLFLDSEKVKFLKEYNVVIEPGIDGDYITTSKHRIGLTKDKFAKLLKNLELILTSGIKISPTMTVHPQEVDKMFQNFLFLESLGLYSIDVHPALFEEWTKKAALGFIKNYKRIADYEIKRKKYLLNKSYSTSINLSLDFVILPTGEILPNWVYLCLAPCKRKKYIIGYIGNNDVIFLKNNLSFFLKMYYEFFKKEKRSYGEVSNFNLMLMRKDIQDKKILSTLENYLKIWEIMKRIDVSNIKRFKAL